MSIPITLPSGNVYRRINWTPKYDKIKFETMVEVGATNLKEDLIEIAYVMREAYGLMFTIERLRYMVKWLKFVYINVKQLLDQPSYQFDEGTRTIFGSGWEEYIQDNEAAARKFDNVLPPMHLMDMVFANVMY
ncbi:hypothetical protein AMTR_s00006p00073230 [Amborella trichopoda]|uniref:Myb/SANT-like domain-containing protein n=1 Tax=Amborella trichopoda TaxID=13333 RepID=W1PD55_AMBTC|nr:hypothetical protein AMTR_s00006p00073230 [Amborella trichopoda]